MSGTARTLSEAYGQNGSLSKIDADGFESKLFILGVHTVLELNHLYRMETGGQMLDTMPKWSLTKCQKPCNCQIDEHSNCGQCLKIIQFNYLDVRSAYVDFALMYYELDNKNMERAAIVVHMAVEINQLHDVFSVEGSFLVRQLKRLFYNSNIEHAAAYYGLCCGNWILLRQMISRRLVCRFISNVSTVPLLVSIPADDRRDFVLHLERERNIVPYQSVHRHSLRLDCIFRSHVQDYSKVDRLIPQHQIKRSTLVKKMLQCLDLHTEMAKYGILNLCQSGTSENEFCAACKDDTISVKRSKSIMARAMRQSRPSHRDEESDSDF